MTGRHSRARAARYERALRALCENSMAEYAAGISWETQEFLRLNDEVAEAERSVGWRRRRWICNRVVRELDYFAHMGGTG